MGHYYSEVRGPRQPTLPEKLKTFIEANHDETFRLTIAAADGSYKALSISRRDLQHLLSERLRALQDLNEIKVMFRSLSRR